MQSQSSRAQLDRNVSLYPWLQVAANALFWLPVFFLYFSEHLTLELVLRLEAIYYAAVVVLEVPSGYFSDRIGRRLTIQVSAAAHVAAFALFFFGGSFAVFAAAQVCLAAGIAFLSGTDTAFHYDTLHALGRDDEYARREAVVAHRSALATALAALAGGAAASFELRWAYGLALAAGVAMLLIAVRLVEPRLPGEPRRAAGMGGQIAACLRCLGRGPLRWLFAFAVMAYALNHVPYHLYQPYADLVLEQSGADLPVNAAPLVTGALTAAIMGIKSWAAARSVRIRDRVGLVRLLLGSLAGQTCLIALCGLLLHPVVLVALLMRSVPTALQQAPLAAAIVPRVERSIRATYLSMQSLAGRLSYAGLLLALSALVEAGAPVTWRGLSTMALAGAAVGVIAFAGLALTARAMRDER